MKIRESIDDKGYFHSPIPRVTCGNGIVHTLTQNARNLPAISKDLDGATAVHQDEYAYDQVGNVLAITDAATGQGQRGNRSMAYDGLDRLTSTTSPMFGTAGYTYDVFDNLTRVQVTAGAQARNQDYCYDAAWRLTNVKTGGCSTGATVVGLGYDVQGNLANKNGVAYTFDYGNRLRGGGPETYRYDAHGRRVRSINGTGGILYSLYSQAGQLLWQRDERTSQRRNYVYLGASLLAEHRRPIGGTTETIAYQHTDALGSPVATTSSAKAVLQRSEYEPYGYLLNRPMEDGPGYTGHATDAATGLVYMQQRYYDPLIGQRFLTVDPVTAYSPGGAFNQYWYAAANPYKLVDRDGRDPGDPVIPRPTGPFNCPECNQTPQPAPSPRPAQSPFSAPAAADASLQFVGLAGNGVGALEVTAGREANAWSAISAHGTGPMARAAAANAADWGGIARGLSRAGASLSFGAGAVETYEATNVGDAFHGVATMVLGAAAIAGYVSGPVGLGIGVIDSAAQQARYTSPITGQSSSGWRAINAAGADAITTQYQHDADLGPIIY